MKDDTIFIVTTMEKLEKDQNEIGWLKTGCTARVGYFHDFLEAQLSVLCNMCDINETCYNYAVIEEMPAGLYPYGVNRWFYKFNYNKEVYEAIETPPFVHECYVFSLR